MSIKVRDTLGILPDLVDLIVFEEDFSGSLARDTLGVGDLAEEDLLPDTIQAQNPDTVRLIKPTGTGWIQGWGMIAWGLPYPEDLKDQFTLILGHEPTLDDFIIMKNNDGQVYLPEFNFNGIGDGIPTQGYQIKLPGNASTFADTPLANWPYGSSTSTEKGWVIRDDQRINFPSMAEVYEALNNPERPESEREIKSGWNMIGYNRLNQPAIAADEILQQLVVGGVVTDITDKVIIMKNNAGQVYLPEFNFNGIGDMISGQGYQIKVTETISDWNWPLAPDPFNTLFDE